MRGQALEAFRVLQRMRQAKVRELRGPRADQDLQGLRKAVHCEIRAQGDGEDSADGRPGSRGEEEMRGLWRAGQGVPQLRQLRRQLLHQEVPQQVRGLPGVPGQAQLMGREP